MPIPLVVTVRMRINQSEDAAGEIGRNPVSKDQIQPELGMETGRLMWDATAEPVWRGQILRRERGQENINFHCSADHEQDWQPYPVDPYSATCPSSINMLHNSGCGKREAHINWSMATCKMAAPVTGTTLRTSDSA